MRAFSIFSLLLIVLGTSSCEVETKNETTQPTDVVLETEDSLSPIQTDSIVPTVPTEISCPWDDYLTSIGLVNIQEVDGSLLVSLKYSTEDNFMNLDVYGCLENCYLQPDVAERLAKCQTALQEIDSNLSLLIYDGLRPRLVQQYMWNLLDMPIEEKVKFVSNPNKGSLHNFGAAVDITLCNKNTQVPLDMGTPYDYIGVLAWPTKEASLLQDSLLTQQQVDNRILLRKVMKAGNFFNIQTEWWHFNACYRNKALELYQIIEGDSSLLTF